MASDSSPPRLPPAPIIRLAWRGHRLLHRASGGRFVWTPESKRGWGALALTTTGRRTGKPRRVILAYLAEGDAFSVVAMNGWLPGHPAWLLNLRDQPHAMVALKGGRVLPVTAREVSGAEREGIWKRWISVDQNMDAWARARSTPTPVVLLERRAETGS